MLDKASKNRKRYTWMQSMTAVVQSEEIETVIGGSPSYKNFDAKYYHRLENKSGEYLSMYLI